MRTTILAACIALAVGTLIGRTTAVSTPVMARTAMEGIAVSQLMDTTQALPVESYDAI